MDSTRQKAGIAAVALAVLLTSCAHRGPDPRDQAFDQHLATLGAQMDAGTITRKEAAVSARDLAQAIFGDPYMTELWSYRVMLADQVERGQTTLEQAAYLDERKVNEITERVQATGARPAALYRPAVTCRPDGWGGMRCR